MKKKVTALCLCVALLAVAVVGASLAYFTDTKSATNTFTVYRGKCQHQTDRVQTPPPRLRWNRGYLYSDTWPDRQRNEVYF